MSFLRRLIGGGDERRPDADRRAGGPPPSEADLDAAEREHEREVLRAEAERLDELRQRQLRYAEHAWTPPVQGGPRRSDDESPAAPT